ncbi:MAG: YciI family protein [Actinomycetota bacterium]
MTDIAKKTAAEELGELFPRLKGIPLYLIEMTPTSAWPDPDDPPTDSMMQHLVDHLHWLEAREQDGTLFLSGPIDADQGVGPGLAVLNVATREEAERLAADEPFARAGLRSNTVRSWTVNEGSITVNLKLFANAIDIGTTPTT